MGDWIKIENGMLLNMDNVFEVNFDDMHAILWGIENHYIWRYGGDAAAAIRAWAKAKVEQTEVSPVYHMIKDGDLPTEYRWVMLACRAADRMPGGFSSARFFTGYYSADDGWNALNHLEDMRPLSKCYTPIWWMELEDAPWPSEPTCASRMEGDKC